MEIRIQYFLLVALAFFVFCLALPSMADSDDNGQQDQAETETPRLEPNIERIPFDPAKIDTEDFEIGVFAGLMSVEDFGVNELYGLRFAYHVSESFFLEAQYALTDTEPTSFEQLSGAVQLIPDEDRELSYYNLSLGYNIFPSESYLGRKYAFNSALYLITGAGATDFAGENRFTINFGIGYRFLINDWLAIHFDMQDHMFDIDILGEEKTSQNLEFHFTISSFF